MNTRVNYLKKIYFRFIMLHILVPGHGNIHRSHNLIKNVVQLQAQISSHCTIYIYNDDIRIDKNMSCTITKFTGKWTDFMRHFQNDDEYVALMIDDVVLKYVDIPDMLRKMQKHNLDAIAPSIHEWHHPIMQPGYKRHLMYRNVLGETPVFSKKKCHGNLRSTKYLDMLFVMFTRRAWNCWHAHLDKENKNGWGFDLLFWNNCHLRMAVDDAYHIEHPKDPQTTYSHIEARQEMFRYIQTEMNMTLPKAKRYRLDVLRGSTRCIKY